MSSPHKNPIFTSEHHALLFACIARSVLARTGEAKAVPLIRQGVQIYGEQRGKRMALRAFANNHPLTTATYLAYGEWAVPKGEMRFTLKDKSPHARIIVTQCPWHTIWKQTGLLDYGKYFCQRIDAALVRGFNPALNIHIPETRTNGGNNCEFVFKDARLTAVNLIGLLFKKKIHPGKAAIMPWAYHCGHLYTTMKQTLEKEIPAHEIISEALADFTHYFTPGHTSVLQSYDHRDFGLLPD